MAFVKSEDINPAISHEEMLDLANKFILSIKLRSWDLLRSMITPDCIWRWPGNGPFSGVAIGSESVIKQISELAGKLTALNLEKVLYGLNGVALSLHFHSVLNGNEKDEALVTVCVLRGYQIAGINTYLRFTEETEH